MVSSSEVMEFLMTYGWAILIVFVALGGIIYFNSNEMLSKSQPSICSLNPNAEGCVCDLNDTEIYLCNGYKHENCRPSCLRAHDPEICTTPHDTGYGVVNVISECEAK